MILDNVGSCKVWVNIFLSFHNGGTYPSMEGRLHFQLEVLGFNFSLLSLLDNSLDFSDDILAIFLLNIDVDYIL